MDLIRLLICYGLRLQAGTETTGKPCNFNVIEQCGSNRVPWFPIPRSGRRTLSCRQCSIPGCDERYPPASGTQKIMEDKYTFQKKYAVMKLPIPMMM